MINDISTTEELTRCFAQQKEVFLQNTYPSYQKRIDNIKALKALKAFFLFFVN